MKNFKKGVFGLVFLLLVTVAGACSYNSANHSSTPTSSEEISSEYESSEEIESSEEVIESSEEISSENESSEEIESSEEVIESSEESSSAYESSEESSSEYESSEEIESSEEVIESSEEISSKYESSEESSSEYESSEEIESSEEVIESSEESASDEMPEEDSSSESGSDEEDSFDSSSDAPSESPSYTLIKPLNDADSSKTLVKTKYKTESAVVVDAIATDFGADPTGAIDSTKAIQAAIDSVKNLGGGSVFLPIGTYLVSSTINVPSYVSLVGDWNKPDAENKNADFDYGTVILAKPQTLGSLKPQARPLFNIGDGSGMVGITFYYVEQDVANVKSYGYTIYGDHPTTATLKNLTFINSTYGIGISLGTIQNELINLENIYGTFLKNAISHNATTDVGFYDNINISPKYWKNASKEYKCGKPYSLDFYVSNNLTAMILGDLDDQLISNVTIDSGKIGIKFTTGIRAEAGFWGLVHNAKITCETGVYADYLHSVSGVVFTDSDVGIVENNSPVGCIKMSNSTYQSAGSGRVVQEAGSLPKSAITTPLTLTFSSSERLFVANNLVKGGVVDNSAALQEIINSVGESGGIVVIPNGIYRLNTSVILPKNVELRSTQAVFSRSGANQSDNNGVVFISYVSGATFVLKENAGIIGVRIWHAKNDFLTAYNSLNSGDYPNDVSIKADGAGAYAYGNESVGAYVSYDFSACDRHVLKSNYGISYETFIKAGGKDGVIVACLSNPNFMTRSNLYKYFDGSEAEIAHWKRISDSGEVNEDFAILRDGIGRSFTKMVRLENAENEIAFHVFAYGHAGLFEMVNTTATLVNTSLDYIPTDKFVYELSGGSCDIIGSLRVHGISVKVNDGRLTAYGRIAFGEVKEKAYDSDVSLADEIEYVSPNATRKTLFNCDSYTRSFNVTPNWNSQYIVEGSGSWKWKTNTLQGSFDPIDISEFKNGYLHFYVYCSDITKIGDVGQIEITSSGTCDVNEYNWNVIPYITKTGWNEIWLDLSTAGTTGGSADLLQINFLRIYLLNASATFYIDNIEVVTD